MKAYKLIGVNPIHLPTKDGERVITPGTPEADYFEHDISEALVAFLTRIEAISVVPKRGARPIKDKQE